MSLSVLNIPWFKGEKLGQRLFRTKAKDTLPHVLTHDRVYILPSRRGWAYVVSLMIMLIASINYSLSLGYALCFMMTGLFCSTLLATYKNLTGLTISSIDTKNGVVGKPISFDFSFRSESTKRMAIDVGDRTTAIRCDIAGDDEVVHQYRRVADQRGWQQLGRITISSGYPLGLWIAWSYLHTDHKCLAFPAPEIPAPPTPVTDSTGGLGDRKPNSGEFDGIREYQPGDPVNAIAWKASARGAGTYVREASSEVSAVDQHFLWQQTSMLGDIEQRISRLTAWIEQAEHDNTRFSLTLPNAATKTGSGIQHAITAKTLLALHGSESDEHKTD